MVSVFDSPDDLAMPTTSYIDGFTMLDTVNSSVFGIVNNSLKDAEQPPQLPPLSWQGEHPGVQLGRAQRASHRTGVGGLPPYVDQNDPPMLLLHGQADTLVPHGQSVDLFNAIAASAATRSSSRCPARATALVTCSAAHTSVPKPSAPLPAANRPLASAHPTPTGP
jgi:hypothetical protein